MLSIQVEDNYFLTGLLRKGALVSLCGLARDGETVKDYISTHYIH